MPPKRGAAKLEEEQQRRREEEAAAMQAAEELHEMLAGEAAGGKVDPTMAMFMLMQKQMKQQEARHQDQMQLLADKLAYLGGGGTGAGLHEGMAAGAQQQPVPQEGGSPSQDGRAARGGYPQGLELSVVHRSIRSGRRS